MGKVRLVQTPWVNHSWHVVLYVTARGLDDVADSVRNADVRDRIRLPQPSADDPHERRPRRARAARAAVRGDVLRAADGGAGGARPEHTHPHQTERGRRGDPLRAGRDAQFVRSRVRRSLLAGSGPGRPGPEDLSIALPRASAVRCMCSGAALDLAVTRFSGRPAPEHPGGIPNLPDWVAREAYSHEVSSCGFWAGGGPIAYPVFYSYAYPEPAGFPDARVRPDAAFYSRELREFLLPYDLVRLADSPDDTLLEFLQSTYEAAATLANWDRQSLELTEIRN